MPVSTGTTNNTSRFANIRKHFSEKENQFFSELFVSHYGRTCSCKTLHHLCPIGLFEKGYSEPDIVHIIQELAKAREEITHDD